MMITKRTLLTPILMIDNFMFPTEKIVGDIYVQTPQLEPVSAWSSCIEIRIRPNGVSRLADLTFRVLLPD